MRNTRNNRQSVFSIIPKFYSIIEFSLGGIGMVLAFLSPLFSDFMSSFLLNISFYFAASFFLMAGLSGPIYGVTIGGGEPCFRKNNPILFWVIVSLIFLCGFVILAAAISYSKIYIGK